MTIKTKTAPTILKTKSDEVQVKGKGNARVWLALKENYSSKTSSLSKSLDIHLLFCLVTGILQAIYYLMAGSFQYNAFLGGFIASVGSFALTANIRLKDSLVDKGTYSVERLIAEYVLGMVVLNIFVANFI